MAFGAFSCRRIDEQLQVLNIYTYQMYTQTRAKHAQICSCSDVHTRSSAREHTHARSAHASTHTHTHTHTHTTRLERILSSSTVWRVSLRRVTTIRDSRQREGEGKEKESLGE